MIISRELRVGYDSVDYYWYETRGLDGLIIPNEYSWSVLALVKARPPAHVLFAFVQRNIIYIRLQVSYREQAVTE